MLLLPLLILQLLQPAGLAPAGLVPAELIPAGPEPRTAVPLPLWGGDVRSLAVHPEDPDLLVAGTSAGHVVRSRDGGRSWENAGVPVPFDGWVVGTLELDPHHPQRLWAGLWGVWGSGLLAVSDDLGATWRERRGSGIHRLPAEPVYDLALDRETPDLLYAGTLSGVWLSRDAGHRWTHLTASYPEVHHVSSLLVQPEGAHPETLLAGTWRRAYRSDDGGLTWRGAFTGMALDSEVFQLRPVPGQAGELWASTCGWVYRSTDLGERWTRFRDGLPERRTPAFAVLPDGRLLAGTIAGLYVSGDRGRTWNRRTDAALSIRAIAHDPRRPDRIVLATEGAGIWISTDGGTSFEPSNRGLTNVRVAALAVVGDETLAAVHHAGPLSGIYRSTDGGRSFEPEGRHLPPVLGFADAGDRLYAATEEGLFERWAGTREWRRVEELGRRRIERLTVEGGAAEPEDARRVAVKTPDARFVRPLPGPARFLEQPRDEDGLDPGSESGFATESAEPKHRFAGQEVLRVLPTGDSRIPRVVIAERDARVFDAVSGALQPPLELAFPAREVVAAAVAGDRLLLGTTGHGLVAVGLSTVAPESPPATKMAR